jgi:hypothetical protein
MKHAVATASVDIRLWDGIQWSYMSINKQDAKCINFTEKCDT